MATLAEESHRRRYFYQDLLATRIAMRCSLAYESDGPSSFQCHLRACCGAPAAVMTSLFDVAADLSQYNDDKPSKAKVPAIHPQSALGILDETFETIYGARQYQSERKYPPLARSTSMVQLQPTHLAESKSAEALDARLNRLASFRATSTPAPRWMNPAIAVAGLIIPPPPSVPPPADNSRKANNIDKDPDIGAKAVLRELTNEIDQLVATSTSSVEEDEALTRMLSDKYIHARLSKLPGTPFVQLVRKKVAQKLDQLEQRLRSRRSTRDPVAVEDDERSNNNDNNSGATPTMPLDGVATWKSLQRLTPDQHKTLQSLLQLPEKQLLRLPKAQLELVQFAKRYEKLVKATPDQLRHLPIEHQQLVRSVQQQQKQLTRADERR